MTDYYYKGVHTWGPYSSGNLVDTYDYAIYGNNDAVATYGTYNGSSSKNLKCAIVPAKSGGSYNRYTSSQVTTLGTRIIEANINIENVSALNYGGHGGIFGIWDAAGHSVRFSYSRHSTGDWRMWKSNGNTETVMKATGAAGTPLANQWFHIKFTIDATNIAVEVNGVSWLSGWAHGLDNDIDHIQIGRGWGYDYGCRYASIGWDWDDNYEEGDNLVEEVQQAKVNFPEYMESVNGLHRNRITKINGK